MGYDTWVKSEISDSGWKCTKKDGHSKKKKIALEKASY